jgi:hypothetical protein
MTEPLAYLIAAAVGAVALYLSQWLAARESARTRAQEALKWMTGNTQRRNVGLGAIEALWSEPTQWKVLRSLGRLARPGATSAQFRQLVTPILCGSAVYLLAASKQGDKPHELYNLVRIMNLLTSATAVTDEDGYLAVLKALRDTCRPGRTGPGVIVDERRSYEWDAKIAARLTSAGVAETDVAKQGDPCQLPSQG